MYHLYFQQMPGYWVRLGKAFDSLDDGLQYINLMGLSVDDYMVISKEFEQAA